MDFRPVLHPVKHSDTAYVWINSTRRRYVSRTFYEPRVRPRAFSETTFVRPKTAEQRFVSCLDICADAKRKWFKTSVEIEPRKFTSSKVIRSANNNYIGTDSPTTIESTTTATTTPNGNFNNERNYQNGDIDSRLHDDRLSDGGDQGLNGYGPDKFGPYDRANGFAERVDPGASQVYIPQRSIRSFGEDSLLNGDIRVDLPNGDLMDRGLRHAAHPSSLSQFML